MLAWWALSSVSGRRNDSRGDLCAVIAINMAILAYTGLTQILLTEVLKIGCAAHLGKPWYRVPNARMRAGQRIDRSTLDPWVWLISRASCSLGLATGRVTSSSGSRSKCIWCTSVVEGVSVSSHVDGRLMSSAALEGIGTQWVLARPRMQGASDSSRGDTKLSTTPVLFVASSR